MCTGRYAPKLRLNLSTLPSTLKKNAECSTPYTLCLSTRLHDITSHHITSHHITSHDTANFILLAVKLMSDRQQRASIATRKAKQVKRENVFLLRPKQIQQQASDCRIPVDGSIVLEMEWKTSSKLGRREEKKWCVQTLITRGRSARGYPTSSSTACLGLIQGVS